MSEKTKLWDSVFETDPSQTKGFSRGGGFKGTAIKPYWLIKRATEVFGPVGVYWGWTELENKMIGGVWCSKVRLWYLYEELDGKIEQWGQTVMEGTNKNGAFVDEEAPKKAITDAVTKCLSYLGFAGDVHMGLFDDSKYVQRVEEGAKEKYRSQSARERELEFARLTDGVNTAKSSAEIDELLKDNKTLIAVLQKQAPEHYTQLKETTEAVRAALAQAEEFNHYSGRRI